MRQQSAFGLRMGTGNEARDQLDRGRVGSRRRNQVAVLVNFPKSSRSRQWACYGSGYHNHTIIPLVKAHSAKVFHNAEGFALLAS